MRSMTIEHLERYNKEIDMKKYCENLKDVDAKENEADFYKMLIKCVWESQKNLQMLKNGRKIDINEIYEKIKNNDGAKREFYRTYQVVSMIQFWLEHKQIYKFDRDMLEMVIGSEEHDLRLDEMQALKMPYGTFVIENEIDTGESVIDSVIVNRRNCELGGVYLGIYGFVRGMETRLLTVDIIVDKNESLYEWLEKRYDKEAKTFVKKVMNLILYLCQPKADVIYKKSEKKPLKEKMPKHFYSVDYNESEVGCKLGSAIRNYRIVYEKRDSLSNPNKKGGTKKPHSRCGHFHHYWVGKGRTDLIVKYVEPTFVLGGNKVATLHDVKK